MSRKTHYFKLVSCLLVAMFFSYTNFSFAQNATSKIEEVYGAVNGTFFQGNRSLFEQFERLLNERVRIEELAYDESEKFPKIASFPLMNKYNSSVQHAPFTSVEGFNPLRYNLNFFSNKIEVYRIDNTPYILIIEPQR